MYDFRAMLPFGLLIGIVCFFNNSWTFADDQEEPLASPIVLAGCGGLFSSNCSSDTNEIIGQANQMMNEYRQRKAQPRLQENPYSNQEQSPFQGGYGHGQQSETDRLIGRAKQMMNAYHQDMDARLRPSDADVTAAQSFPNSLEGRLGTAKILHYDCFKNRKGYLEPPTCNQALEVDTELCTRYGHQPTCDNLDRMRAKMQADIYSNQSRIKSMSSQQRQNAINDQAHAAQMGRGYGDMARQAVGRGNYTEAEILQNRANEFEQRRQYDEDIANSPQ